MKKIVLFLTAFILALALGLIGAPAGAVASDQLSVVPADAQWALHIDFQRLTSSAMFKALGGEHKMAMIQGKADDFFKKLQIDPEKDVKGVTVYGRGKEDGLMRHQPDRISDQSRSGMKNPNTEVSCKTRSI